MDKRASVTTTNKRLSFNNTDLHSGPKDYICSSKIKCSVIYLCACLFQSFRRDSIKAKAVFILSIILSAALTFMTLRLNFSLAYLMTIVEI